MHQRPVLLGHRGSRSSVSVAENSIAAFDIALKDGCDGFEFDVRLTASGRAVVCHDAAVHGIAVAKAEAEQLRQLPILRDTLKRYAQRAFLDIELKVPGLDSELLIALQEHPPERGYVVSSFLPEVLTDLRMRSEEIPLGLICEQRQQLNGWQKLPVEYLILHTSLITREVVGELHDAGQKLIAWTVNDAPAMLRLAGWGIDGIISDDTALLAKAFS